MHKSASAFNVAVDPPALPFSASPTPVSNVVDSSLPAADDVSNLFARFGAGDGAVRYREIHSDADAAAAAARWPLLAEWLAARSPAEAQR